MTLSVPKRAAHWPDRTAVVDTGRDERLSYGALAERIEAAAGRLAAWNVGAGDRVAILAQNSVDVLALLFGAHNRGATIAPISQRLTGDTVATLLDRIDPKLVLAEPAFADLAGRDTVTVEEFNSREPAANPEAPSDAVPLFLHTGGTTGVPKVVPLSARQLEWNAITEVVSWGLDSETVTVTMLPLFHTGGWNLLTLPTLYAGGTVVLLPEFDPGEALRCVEQYGATQLFGVAAIYRALADHHHFEETDFSTVEWCMSGGGPCPQSVMEPYRDRDITFAQGYGLTEGGPNNLFVHPDRDDTVEKSESVGRPFPDCEARLVDADGTPVEGAGSGELELRGPVTADGYLQTADGTFEGEWVSTGDVATRDSDGDYYIIGRTDNMFVSGGENVYPEEIEDTLESHPDVAAVGVTPIDHEKWGQVPKAVVVGDVAETTLDSYARDHLADFQVPDTYVFVDALPETGAGKLDRDRLDSKYGT